MDGQVLVCLIRLALRRACVGIWYATDRPLFCRKLEGLIFVSKCHTHSKLPIVFVVYCVEIKSIN